MRVARKTNHRNGKAVVIRSNTLHDRVHRGRLKGGGSGGIDLPLDFEIWHFPIRIFAKKRIVFLLSRRKNYISSLFCSSPCKNLHGYRYLWKNSLLPPLPSPEQILPTPMACTRLTDWQKHSRAFAWGCKAQRRGCHVVAAPWPGSVAKWSSSWTRPEVSPLQVCCAHSTTGQQSSRYWQLQSECDLRLCVRENCVFVKKRIRKKTVI